jgi:leucyl-tRNA synthetase
MGSGGGGPGPQRYTAELAGRIETRWQAWWAEDRTYRQPNPGEPGFDGAKPKFYCLDMFPYPSGAGLHVGHPEGYTATDIICRYKRMTGHNVLRPMGWDAFGLPAEQYAIQTGVHPEITTRKAIENFRRQLQRFGFSYDWEREVGTIDPEYYEWTQWVFLRVYGSWFDRQAGELGRARPIGELIEEFETGARPVRLNPDAAEHTTAEKARRWASWGETSDDDRRTILDSYRMAYLGEQTVNWCPKLGTALANDEVTAEGRSERGGFPVLRKPMRQWMLRITAYGERLLADLGQLDWPESTKTQQAEWIGRSEGAEIDFAVGGAGAGLPALRVYTTRPDTLFGATFMVVAPEHPLVAAASDLGGNAQAGALRAYAAAAKNRSDVERQETKDKTGVYTGVDAINPATGGPIPVWCADYVLMGYGTGAIMAVPAGDERDFAFAQKFGLPIRDVVYPTVVLAMKFYAEQALPEEMEGDGPGGWRFALADFLGMVASADVPPEQFARALSTVRARRRQGPDAIASSPSGRGSVRMVWLETIESLAPAEGRAGFEDLRARFSRGEHWVRQGEAYTGAGRLVNSALVGPTARGGGVSLDGLSVGDAKARMIEWLERAGVGQRKVNLRLRDWVFSRQRYWGEPFPIVFDSKGRHHPVREDRLPVVLPPLADYQPVESDNPQPLLAKAREWANLTAGQAGVDGLDPNEPVRRETNTMPGSAGSSWYYLRYIDPRNTTRFASRASERYWMLSPREGVQRREAEKFGTFEPHLHRLGGIDLYLGGSEHAVGHLLYFRFWHKVLFDLGEVSTPEPAQKLFHQGLITSYAYQRKDKSLVPVDQVENRGTEEKPVWIETATGQPVAQIVAKMSKSLKNVVNPDDVIAEFGADTFRLYEMYMGPLEQSKPWNTRDIIGLFRFLRDVWKLCVDEQTGALRLGADADAGVERRLHRTIHKVGEDIGRLSFNTAIAALIEFKNAATVLTFDQMDRLARALSPLAPHIAEEIWDRLGQRTALGSVARQPWPAVDPGMLRDDEIEIPVQVMGKVRSRVTVPAGAGEDLVREAALADPRVRECLEGKAIKKVIVVPGKMVNIVAG